MKKSAAVKLALEIAGINLSELSSNYSINPDLLLAVLSKDSYNLAKDLGISNRKATEISKVIAPDKNSKHSAIYALLLRLGHRQCQNCKEVVVIEEFYSNSTYCVDCTKARNNSWYENNVIEKAAYNAQYQLDNRKVLNAYGAKKKADKIRAIPKWANLDKIKEIYATCPEGYHVDHIVPLKGTNVCGLHVETNLQHLPARDNIRKGNKYEP